jgi:dTDP-glucose pyrophosphorylase
LEHHNKNDNSDVTLGCFKTDNPTSVSVVEFEGDLITNVIEIPKETNLENMWGMMVWNPIFSDILNEFCLTRKPKEGAKELYLSDALFPLIEKNKAYAFTCENSNYRDLGTFRELNRWSRLLQTN